MTMQLIQQKSERFADTTTSGRLLGLMLREGVKKQEIANAIDVSASGVTRRLQGKTEWALYEMKTVALMLNTTVGYLLGETDDDRRPSHLGATTKEPSVAEAMEGIDIDWRAPRDSNPRPSDP